MCPLLIIIFLGFSQALNRDDANLVQNENCSQYISELPKNYSSSECPPWHVMGSNGSGCVQGLHVHFLVYFMQETSQPWLQTFYCMTTSTEYSEQNERDVIGTCLYSFDIDSRSFSTYFSLPCNISKLNEYMCAGLNRDGQLCGKCNEGYAPPAFSYSLACVKCTDYHFNWLKYFGAAFGPLTIFCLLICFFHISVMSPYLHGIVFYSQILTAPMIMRMLTNTRGYIDENSTQIRHLEQFYLSLFSFWNLDILRAFYEPFCLHPNITVVQSLALDYIIALYPLLLITMALFLVSLYGRRNRIVTAMWRPFKKLVQPFFHHLNIQTSLIESFATLYFLSAMKIQSVSLDLLIPTPLYYVDESVSDNLYLYLAGDVEYFGRKHLPYGLLGLFFLVIFALLPALLLFLYPYRCFRRFLQKIHCDSLKLKTFMDVFQGHYKDGTNNTRDYRFFSGIFFVTRFVILVNFIVLSSFYSVMVLGCILVMLGFSVAMLHPQTTKLHYTLDCTILLVFSLLAFALIGNMLVPASIIDWQISSSFNTITVALPLFFMGGVTCYWLIAKKKIPQRIVKQISGKSRQFCSQLSESQQLIQY